MKKLILLMLAIATALIFAGCSEAKAPIITPEYTVQQYFEYWQGKDIAKMNSLLFEKAKLTDTEPALDELNNVKLISCKQRTEYINWDPQWYDHWIPYEFAVVDVSFTAEYNNGGGSETYQDYRFYLAKKQEGSNWQIVKLYAATPEQTVRQYFEYWQAKNLNGMNSLKYGSPLTSTELALDDLNYVTLNSCKERTEYIDFRKEWFDNKTPYKIARVDVSFTVDYKNEDSTNFTNGTYDYWSFYLVKETENSDWVIVMQGVGGNYE